MDYKVRMEILENLIVEDMILNDYVIDLRDRLDHLNALFNGLCRESVISDHLRIAKNTDSNTA